uniref:Uncharacterized protein n=1 Tax=Oryza glumipatula TaxID=40148 RepID=A0A0D9ZVU5_9ORYZ
MRRLVGGRALVQRCPHIDGEWPVVEKWSDNMLRMEEEYITSAAQDSAFNRDENGETQHSWYDRNAWNVKLSETEEVVVSE